MGREVGGAAGGFVGDSVVRFSVGECVRNAVDGDSVGRVVGDAVIGDSVGESVGSAVTGDWVGKSVGDSVGGDLVGGAVLLQKSASYAAMLNKAQPESFWGKYPSILNVGLTDSSSPVQA